MLTLWELCMYLHNQDHRLLTLDILGNPSLFGDILFGDNKDITK